PPYDLLGPIVSNASTITTMNDSAACGTLFYDANGQTVPPNTTLLLVSSDICAEINFDWSSLCGSGPIYVVFGQSGTLGDTWHDSGNFGNSSGTKTFDLDITATDAITYGYTYSYVSGNQGDGEYATFSSSPPGGNALNTGVLPDCKITVAVLPIELLSFTGKSIGSSNLLEWKTTTEINNDYFTLERSSNATHFSELGIIEGAGNSNTMLYYNFTDENPLNGVNYYRLKQTDFDGRFSYSNIVALSNKTTAFSIWNSAETLFIKGDNENSTSSLKIYNLLGELVLEKYFQENITINTTDFSSGIYLVKIQSNENLITQKVKF
ncbi:MAG TPA: T9SS type A sorting domain-containing protein, partial [Vicingus sp.]|nr:T9SS type A sorting domain-containing protein [Vicingus sp.]